MQVSSGYSSVMSSYYASKLSQSKSTNAGGTASGKAGKNGGDEELFSKVDSDGDGKVNASEMSSFLKQMQANAPQNGTSSQDVSGVGQTGQGMGLQSYSQEDLEAMFSEVDEDSDGSLSLSEFSALGEKMRPEGPPPGGGPGGPPPSGPPPTEDEEEEDLLSALSSSATSIEDLLAAEEEDETSMYAQLLSALSNGDGSNSAQFTSYMQKMLTKAYSAGAIGA